MTIEVKMSKNPALRNNLFGGNNGRLNGKHSHSHREHAVHDPEIPPEPDMKYTLEYLTPEIAAEYFAKNFPRNRHKKKGQIEKLALQIKQGNWRTTHQGIAFNEYGELVDGQNRLAAIIMSGVGVWVWVARGVLHKDVMAVDRGSNRTASDQIHIVTDLNNVSTDTVAVARALIAGVSYSSMNRYLSDYAMAEVLVTYDDVLQRVCQQKYKRRGITSSVRGTIARAYDYLDHAVVDRFLDVISVDMPNGPEESSAYRLREFCLAQAGRGGGNAMVPILIRKTTAALLAFSEKRPIAHLYESSLNPWPPKRFPAGHVLALKN